MMKPSAAALVSVGVSLADMMGETGELKDCGSDMTGSGEPDFILRPKPGLSDMDRR